MAKVTDDQIIKDHPTEFEQGQRARLSSINPEDGPYDKGSDLGRAWQLGFNAAEGEAARNRTSGPVELQDNDADDGKGDGKAASQIDTAAPANKAK